MKLFLTKISGFIVAISVIFILICSRFNGYTDSYYLNFTSSKSSSMVFGTSKAAQGLQPQVFDSILKKTFSNYSFSLEQSPYGPTYLKSIKKKLDLKIKDGIFILSIDPWSLARYSNEDNPNNFRETNLALGNMNFVSLKPNPFYVLKNYKKKYYNILLNRDKRAFLHDNGWLEVNINMDSTAIAKRIQRKLKFYEGNILKKSQFSPLRLSYFKETITFLSSFGKVYLVRLPVHPDVMTIEDTFMPDFNSKIQEATLMSSGYLDMTEYNNSFVYTDGNHLHKDSARIVSSIVAKWIKKNN